MGFVCRFIRFSCKVGYVQGAKLVMIFLVYMDFADMQRDKNKKKC